MVGTRRAGGMGLQGQGFSPRYYQVSTSPRFVPTARNLCVTGQCSKGAVAPARGLWGAASMCFVFFSPFNTKLRNRRGTGCCVSALKTGP